MTSVTFQQLLQDYGSGTEVVPDGPYDIVVFHAQVVNSRTNPPKSMIVARCRILSGPYANKVLMHNFVLTPDNPGAMFHWFRNFSILGLGADYFNALPPDIGQALQQIAADLVNRTAHVTAETSGGRQNLNFTAPSASPVTPHPQAPQPAPGMQPQFGTPQFQQPGMPPQQPYPQAPAAAPQPQVAPPPVGGTPPGYPAPPAQVPGVPQQPQGYPAPPNGPAPGQPLNVPGAPGYQQPQAAPAPAPAPPPPGPGSFPPPPGQPVQGTPGFQPGTPQAPAPSQYPAPPAGQQPEQQAQPGFPVPGQPPPQVPV